MCRLVRACRRDVSNLLDLRAAGVVDGRTLVTASALLDLVSEAWVATLAALCHRAGAVVLVRAHVQRPADLLALRA